MSKPKRKTKLEVDTQLIDDLAECLNFSLNDLSANQQGHMTTHQIGILRQKRRQGQSIKRIGELLSYLLYGVSQQAEKWNRIGYDITLRQTQSQHGTISLPLKRHKSLPVNHYPLKIGRATFELDVQALPPFRHLEACTAYYAPRSRILLSAEPL